MTGKQGFSDDDHPVLRVLRTKKAVKAYYNKIARVYDLLAERSERPMREAGLEKLAVKPGEQVLEVGFGTGHCLLALAKAVGPQGKVHGIDISENMLAHARELLEREGLADRCTLICGDALKLPFPDEAFDAVFFSFTLELFDTPELPLVLEECRRVLRPNGRIAVVAVSKESENSVTVHLYEWIHRHFPNLMDCRPIYVRHSLEAAGFEVSDATIGHMWVPVEIVLAGK